MTNLKHLEEKIIDSFKEDFDGENSYIIVKFKGGGKLNIVSFLNGDKGTAQLDIDTGKLKPQEIIGKKIKKFTETFDGETDHLEIHLEGGHIIKITPFSSNPESTASLDTNIYAGDKVVAESLNENTYQKWGEYPLNKPQYENSHDSNNEICVLIKSHAISDRKILDILKEIYPESYFAGDVENSGTRAIMVKDSTASVEDVSDILYKYIENGTVYTVDEI